MDIGELFFLNQCPQSGADNPIWSIELNMHACHLLLSSVVDLDGRVLHMSEVGALLNELLSQEFPHVFDQAYSTSSTTSAQSGLRHAPVIRFDEHLVITNGVAELSAPPAVLAAKAAQLRAPTINNRVSSTEDGVGQDVEKAREKGGRYQKDAAGEPGSKRDEVAKKSVFFKSRARDGAPYVEHTQRLELGGIGFMAHILRGLEQMGASRGVQWPWLAAARAAAAAAAETTSAAAVRALASSPERPRFSGQLAARPGVGGVAEAAQQRGRWPYGWVAA